MKDDKKRNNTSTPNDGLHKVGLLGLIAIVIGSMIGGGIFNLPKEMAVNAGVAPTAIAWAITGVGIYFIAKVFQILSDERSDITGGIYFYAKEGFGSFVGFNSAWGYWVSNVIGNVSFAILFVDALAKFIPSIKGSYTIKGIIISTILIWAVVFVVAKGLKTATALNTISTIAKIVPIIIAIFLLFLAFKLDIFDSDIWGKNITLYGKGLGSTYKQVNNVLLQTLWVFIGVEGAVVISDRAKNSKDIGKATIIGYISVLISYVLIVFLSFAAVPQKKLAALNVPSLGGVLEITNGEWAASLIDLGVIISVLGAWVSWTILTAEIPVTVAKDKMFPKFFAKTNNEGAPINALLINAGIMQICYFITLFADNAFQAVTNTATTMVLIPYALSAGFLFKLGKEKNNKKNIFYGAGGVIFGLYMIYSAGVNNLIYCTILYALGIFFLIRKSRENNTPLFDNEKDKLIGRILWTIGGLAAIYLIFQYIKTIK